MVKFFTHGILTALEHEIEDKPIINPDPMLGDPWLLASAMQKAIRRGETERALSAAISLWYHDRPRFWRRLHITAMEDIGIGDMGAMLSVLNACANSQWRRRVGDLRVGLYLVQLLSQGVKCRVADAVYILAERDKKHDFLRSELSGLGDDKIAAMVLDETVGLIPRCIAAWYLAGHRKFPSDVMPQRIGSLDAALFTIRVLSIQQDIIEACAGVISRTPWPLALMIPIIQSEVVRNTDKGVVETVTIPFVPDVDGMPIYAADTFTRVGKSCIRQLQKSVSCFKGFDTRQIGLGVFYLEGGMVDKNLSSSWLFDTEQAGEITDLEASGLCMASYMALRVCLKDNWEVFTEIRKKELRFYFQGIVA